jgi:hypothetical protein
MPGRDHPPSAGRFVGHRRAWNRKSNEKSQEEIRNNGRFPRKDDFHRSTPYKADSHEKHEKARKKSGGLERHQVFLDLKFWCTEVDE